MHHPHGRRVDARVADAARRAGQSVQTFVVEAIMQAVEQGEIDKALDRLADTRWTALMADGKSVPLDQARAWVAVRARGECAVRPEARGSGG